MSVAGGILTGRLRGYFLVYEAGAYRNFHLRTEVSMDTEGGDAGLQIRRKRLSDEVSSNYEVQIGGGPNLAGTGDLFVFPPGKQSLVHRGRNRPPLAFGEWFTLELIADGSSITTKVNDQTLVTLRDQSRDFTEGTVALQRTEKTVVRFRKIEIKELPTSPAAAVP